MIDLSPIASWTASDVQHLARRAGFGLSPEDAAAMASRSPPQAVADWVDGTGVDGALFASVLADRADPVTEAARSASKNATGGVDVPAVPGPHRYLVDGPDSWRNDLARAQALLAFRMQYAPYSFAERMGLFWGNFFATGWHKVNSVSLMLKQAETLRSHGLDHFDDLLVLVSKDPAMAVWLDLVLDNAAGTAVPNENYAREVMELYSLGADDGYSQTDITQLARALSGWSFTVRTADWVANPTNPNLHQAAAATFRLYDGKANPDGLLWNGAARATTTPMHGSGTITYLGKTFDIGAAPAGMTPGEDALRSIVSSRASNCAGFLARRLLTHFVTARFSTGDLADVTALVQAKGFDLRAVLKALLSSTYFFSSDNRFALVEGPISWIARAARMLGLPLAAAAPKSFPAWYLVTGPAFEGAGMKLLDPTGPNGWKEDVTWMNSNTIRWRTRLAAALTLGETANYAGSSYPLFPTDVARWFPTAPASPSGVLDRLAALLQPAPIPPAVTAGWLSALWPGSFAWDAAGQSKARELAYLVLCSPAGQLY